MYKKKQGNSFLNLAYLMHESIQNSYFGQCVQDRLFISYRLSDFFKKKDKRFLLSDVASSYLYGFYWKLLLIAPWLIIQPSKFYFSDSAGGFEWKDKFGFVERH